MNTESLHTLSAAVLVLGVVFTGAGGFGLYHFSRAGGKRESGHAGVEDQLRAKLSALQKENDDLRERLRVSESKSAAAPERTVPAAVTAPPPPAPADWAGDSLLEELIETTAPATPPAEPKVSVLGEAVRAAIMEVLKEYPGRGIAIHSVDGDSAGFEYARALKEAFVEAGWRVDGVDQVANANAPAGILITPGLSSSPEETIIPHEALATAGLDVYRGVNTDRRSQKTVLLVGVGLK